MNGKLHVVMLLCLSLLVSSQNGYAQSVTSNEKTETSAVAANKPVSLSLNLGTQGAGICAKKKLSDRWYVVLGGSYLPVDYSGAIKLSGYNTKMHLTTSFANAHLLAEMRLKNWVRLVGGFGFFANADIKGVITVRDARKYGDIIVQPADIGEIDADITYKGIAPYLGLSLFRAQPTNRVNLNLDLGTYYFLSQDVKMSGTKLLAGNDVNTAQLKENLSDYRWLPVLQININFKLTK